MMVSNFSTESYGINFSTESYESYGKQLQY